MKCYKILFVTRLVWQWPYPCLTFIKEPFKISSLNFPTMMLSPWTNLNITRSLCITSKFRRRPWLLWRHLHCKSSSMIRVSKARYRWANYFLLETFRWSAPFHCTKSSQISALGIKRNRLLRSKMLAKTIPFLRYRIKTLAISQLAKSTSSLIFNRATLKKNSCVIINWNCNIKRKSGKKQLKLKL